jgi:hypothetical protein
VDGQLISTLPSHGSCRKPIHQPEPSQTSQRRDLGTSRDFCRKEANEPKKRKEPPPVHGFKPRRTSSPRESSPAPGVLIGTAGVFAGARIEHIPAPPHRGRRHRVGGLAHSCAEWAEENSQSHNLRYTLLYWFQFMMVIFVIYTFCRINLAMVDL